MQVFVTRGPYAGRFIEMDDDWAEKAKADGWARETPNQTPEEQQAEAEQAASGEPVEEPASLTEWLQSLDPAGNGNQGKPEGEAKPRAHRPAAGARAPHAASSRASKAEEGEDASEGEDEDDDEGDGGSSSGRSGRRRSSR